MTVSDYVLNPVLVAASPHMQRYLNAQVTIYYHPAGGGVSDQGRITYLDNFWVELTKEKGEILLIPTGSIRIVKVLEPPKLQGDAGILLRAAEPLPEEQRKQITRE